ncbi:MAG: hypothetical protein QM770_05045 [Tepidisphaeraceae bacterium]
MKRKMSWRSLKFIPLGGDESQAIRRGQPGFMHLCEKYRYGSAFSGFTIHDTKGMFERYGHNNVDVSWSDFRLALIKYQMQSPPEKPSMFCGRPFPDENAIEMRKRLLAAFCREYIFASSLAEDLLEWLAVGKEEDIRSFILTLLSRVGWLEQFRRGGQSPSSQQAQQGELTNP